ncbi:MAG: hypothetical protein ACTHLI_09665, partial [Amnibacterium sp.]
REYLVRAAREHTLPEPGRLAATLLGRRAASESAVAMGVAGVSSLIGAVAPLAVGAAFPTVPILVLGIAVLGLGALGWALAVLIAGGRVRWAVGMLVGGTAITAIGAALHIT